MPSYTTKDIRNIALVGAGGTGKTILVESLLAAAGVINQKGEIARGTTVCDHQAQEQAHEHSLDPAVASFDHMGKHLNLLDTPGSPDFIGRALSVLPAVETVAVVVNAAAGPDMTARRMMDWAHARGLDRIVIINRIDEAPNELESCLTRVQELFGSKCLPLNLPAKGASEVLDCYFKPNGAGTDFSSVEEAHTELVDQVVEVDDELMELYLEQGEDISPEQLHDPFEKALREDHLIPVCFTSAETDAGVEQLLDVFCKLMPSPEEGNPPDFFLGEDDSGEAIHFEPDPKKPVLAHTFKINIDPFIGRLGVFRIHQGTVTKDSQLCIGDARRPFRVSHLLKLRGGETSEIDAGIPGDICALAKVDEMEFDAVLHDAQEEGQIHMRALQLPTPMQGVALTAKSRGQEQKLSDAMNKLKAEDPSIVIEHNNVQNQTIMRAVGDLHLRILLEALNDRFNVEVETAPPKIAYRETIRVPAEGHHRHKKQTGGAGQFGEVFIRIAPLSRGEGFKFTDAIVGGAIPRQFIPAVEKGVKQAMGEGIIAGYPLEDVEVTLYDGKFHAVDSKEVAFVAAGKKAFIDAVKKAGPVVLEPIVNVDIVAPSTNVGDITGDLSSKRARINETTAFADGMSGISAAVPLAELDGYQSQLRSITAGAGTFSLELSHYDPVPAKTQADLAAEFRPGDAEE
jgi:elongation factor G